ncbi:SRPBCC domain-containing protein [Pseudaquabacterium terrae]|uniref:SRPBCC domain-containing protein n=1 Tax=Pseudaquabacterium terrae TaxID=2732868 RepID=UPI003CCE2DF0
MSFTNFTSGNNHAFGGQYLELVPSERVRYDCRFEDAGLPGLMQTTVTLKAVSVGTEVHIAQESVLEMHPLEACYLGWQESCATLADGQSATAKLRGCPPSNRAFGDGPFR